MIDRPPVRVGPRDVEAVPPLGPGVASVYLHAGRIAVSGEPCRVTTILGSCVAVGVWDPVARVGGLNHFLLPHGADNLSPSPRYGRVAIDQLLEAVVNAGASRTRLQAKLFGGACVLQAFQHMAGHLGQRNVEVAREVLRDHAIPVCAEDVEGERGRKLIFETHDGTAWVRSL